ncbi:MAG: hypothetical protein ACOY71_05270, partial [Gemmatimonadota bacterium]
RAARARGRVAFRRLIAVDRDPACQLIREVVDPAVLLEVAEWGEFFDRWLAEPRATAPDSSGPPDAIVPSPLMPHLMYEWLERRARARWPGRSIARAPLALPLGTPYEHVGKDGTSYVSFADWLCPTHCVEPAICPVIDGPRTWEMSDAVTALTARLARLSPAAGPALFHCRHQVFGVGMFTVPEVLACDRLVAAAGASGAQVDVVVGTVSACHGALSVLRLGPEEGNG